MFESSSKKSLITLFFIVIKFTAQSQTTLDIEWDKSLLVSQSVSTLQVVVNPPLRRGSSIHDQSFNALKKLEADYVRFVPWLPYPKLGVAELEPPADKKNFLGFFFD